MMDLLTMLAAAPSGAAGAAGAATGQGGPSMWPTIFMLVAMFAIFYFLLIRPQQKQQKEHRDMVANLRKGDRVATNGGMIGKIVKVTDEDLTIEIARVAAGDSVKVKVLRNAVLQVLAKTEPAPANDADDED